MRPFFYIAVAMDIKTKQWLDSIQAGNVPEKSITVSIEDLEEVESILSELGFEYFDTSRPRQKYKGRGSRYNSKDSSDTYISSCANGKQLKVTLCSRQGFGKWYGVLICKEVETE